MQGSVVVGIKGQRKDGRIAISPLTVEDFEIALWFYNNRCAFNKNFKYKNQIVNVKVKTGMFHLCVLADLEQQ